MIVKLGLLALTTFDVIADCHRMAPNNLRFLRVLLGFSNLPITSTTGISANYHSLDVG